MADKLNHQHVKALSIELADGSIERWVFEDGDPFAYYTVASRYKTKEGGSARIIERWQAHEIRFISDHQRPTGEAGDGK